MSKRMSTIVAVAVGLVIAGAAAGLIFQQREVEAQNAELRTTNAQIQQTGAQIQHDNTQLQQLVLQDNAQLEKASLPQLPVAVGFRKALLGPGKVARIESVAGKGLAVHARVIDAVAHHEHDFNINVDAGRFAELGHNQGYTFEAGDRLTLEHDGYKSMTWVVP